MRTTNNLILFWSGMLSNWAPTPYTFEGTTYCCSEQEYMAAKAYYFGDMETAAKIMATTNPKEIKRLGRMVRDYDDEQWARVRYRIMRYCVFHKFTLNKEANKFLMKQPAYHEFAEASPFDTIWGIGYSEDDPKAHDKSTWRGQNLLGQAITSVYNELKTQQPNLFNNE